MKPSLGLFAASLAVSLPLAASCGGGGTAGSPDATPIPDPIANHVALTPAQGFTYTIAPFTVDAGVEEQDCYFVEVPDINSGGDVWINHFVMGLEPGSHHTNVFRIKTIVNLSGVPGDVVKNGECFKAPNWADWPLVVNSQASTVGHNVVDWPLPAGVAQKFAPHEVLMIQTHYVNATTQKTPGVGALFIDFYKSPDASPIEMGTLFATEQSIRICQSNPTPSYHGTCAFPAGQPVHVAAANGHFHSRGKQFDVFSWDGTSITQPADAAKFYESTAWDDPPMMTGLDTQIPAGGGVWWTCDYQWTPPEAPATCDALNMLDKQHANDCCYTFGGKVETGEHCNVFVYYWPKVTGDVFCN